MMSEEAGARLMECSAAIYKTHATFFGETGDSRFAVFDALRLYMVAAAAFLARSGMHVTDENLHTVLYEMVDLAINDYQMNERLHVGSKEGS